MPEHAADVAEIEQAFRDFQTQGTPPTALTKAARDYLRHSLAKAMQTAALQGKELGLDHHQFYALLALQADDPARVVEFVRLLYALPDTRPGDA